MDRFTGGCLCGNVRSANEVEVNLESLDAPDQLMPTYELWTIRRESWLPTFPLARRYERDRDWLNAATRQRSPTR